MASTACKFAIVTGSNSGLGLHLVKRLYRSGVYSTIVMACRNEQSAQKAISDVQQQQPDADSKQQIDREDRQQPELRFLQLDLASRTSVSKFVEEFASLCPSGHLHLLVNNAGIMGHPHQLSADGVELHFATNHLGHFQLTNLLLGSGCFSEHSRILLITSGYYEKCQKLLPAEELQLATALMSPVAYYSHSKLANCLHAIALARRLEKERRGIRVVAVRPGFVAGTQLGRNTNPILRWLAAPLIWMVAKNLDQGISTALHCIECEEVENGALYHERKRIGYNEGVANAENAEALWQISESLLLKQP